MNRTLLLSTICILTAAGQLSAQDHAIEEGDIKIGAQEYSHITTPELLRRHTAQLFDWILEGKLTLQKKTTYPLEEAAQALADIESRATTGKLLLLPAGK